MGIFESFMQGGIPVHQICNLSKIYVFVRITVYDFVPNILSFLSVNFYGTKTVEN